MTYDALAELLDYPQPDLADAAERAGLSDFAAWAAGVDARELEEVYTRTFDLSAPCCLELGWHLFGETYKRGEFLVRMTVAARAHGVVPGTELADHLAVVLRLLGRLGPDEDARGLVEEAVLPAIEKMIAAVADNPYRGLLAAVETRLRADFELPFVAKQEPPRRLPLYDYPEVER
jgi:nitrate reductase molybdenum cofactor assembly chaperone NarJ/NarW